MRQALWVAGVLFSSLLYISAQDLDSVPSVQRRNTATLADQIGDQAERSGFLELFKPAPPAEMGARAVDFISRFPESAFLAQAYEIAARGSFDLGEYEQGLGYARESLTLLPENPLLLVPVADVEARQHINASAVEDA